MMCKFMYNCACVCVCVWGGVNTKHEKTKYSEDFLYLIYANVLAKKKVFRAI